MIPAVGYTPTKGYYLSTVEKPATVDETVTVPTGTLEQSVNTVGLVQRVARWLNTDEATALDWLVYKVAAFRGIPEHDARQMIVGGL